MEVDHRSKIQEKVRHHLTYTYHQDQGSTIPTFVHHLLDPAALVSAEPTPIPWARALGNGCSKSLRNIFGCLDCFHMASACSCGHSVKSMSMLRLLRFKARLLVVRPFFLGRHGRLPSPPSGLSPSAPGRPTCISDCSSPSRTFLPRTSWTIALISTNRMLTNACMLMENRANSATEKSCRVHSVLSRIYSGRTAYPSTTSGGNSPWSGSRICLSRPTPSTTAGGACSVPGGTSLHVEVAHVAWEDDGRDQGRWGCLDPVTFSPLSR